SEAAKFGAIAAIVRSVTSKYDNTPHVGTLSYEKDVKKIPSVTIGLMDADFLSKAIINEPDLEINIRMDCKSFPDTISYNVIGEIKGKEKSNEIIVVGGHFDSWDKGHGAHDDGAPCIQTMEVLDIFKKLNLIPKRTIRCVLFINEENGLRGALKYGEYSESSNQYHLAAIESDRGAFTPRGFTVDADSLIIYKMQSWFPIVNMAKIDWIKKGGSGADISKIKNTKALIGYVPDNLRYFDVHHSDNDIIESVNPKEMQLGTAAITILTYLISEEGL
ncbi:M28 family peptidase, partial [Bacteroidota bacterium]